MDITSLTALLKDKLAQYICDIEVGLAKLFQPIIN